MTDEVRRRSNANGKSIWWFIAEFPRGFALFLAIAGAALLGATKVVSIVWPHHTAINKSLTLWGSSFLGLAFLILVLKVVNRLRFRVPWPGWYRDLRKATIMDPVIMLGLASLLTFTSVGSRITPDAGVHFVEAIPFAVLATLAFTGASRREHAYALLSQRHAILTFLWAALVLMYILATYAWVTAVVADDFHWIKFSNTIGPVPPLTIAEFYLWHLTNAIPVLDLNNTFHWSPPLTYTSFVIGLLVFAFLATVAAPVIGIFAEWRKYRKDHPKAAPAPVQHHDRSDSASTADENPGPKAQLTPVPAAQPSTELPPESTEPSAESPGC